jgi:ribosomal protein L37AE/L43A
MRKSGAITRGIVIVLMIMVLCIFGLSTAVAQDSGGPLTISGRVYDADGNNPGDGYEGTDAAVIVEHNGVRTKYMDDDGLEQAIDGTYWYDVTIPQGGWEIGDTFWVWVEGSKWDDQDFTCVDHDDTSISSWTIENDGAIEQDVDTNGSNLKPIIAWIFAIILVVVGIVVGLVKPLKVPASGWPREPADLTDDILIGGVAEMPEEGISAPEAAAPPAAEEHVCGTCGGAYKYIPEYDAWYCETCKTYEEAPTEEAPDEEKTAEPTCKTCGGKLEFIEKYDRWYCRTCAKYAEPEDVAPPEPSPPPGDLPPPGPEGGV